MARKEHDHEPRNNLEQFSVITLPGFPEIEKGTNLASLIFELSEQIGGLTENDVIVIASKIVSKSEGLVVDTSQVPVSEDARRLAEATGKPAPVCQLILDESTKHVVRDRTIIAHHRLGYILTSAGVDRVDSSHVSLIPRDPDQSARGIREELEKYAQINLAVVISDSEGREDRAGAGAVALGVSGIDPVRKTVSPQGKVQYETISDMIAMAAGISIGQRGKNSPVVIIRGLRLERNLQSRMQDYLRKD